jgi:hypothetical protein
MDSGEAVELGYELDVATAGEIGLDTRLERGETLLLEADRFRSCQRRLGRIGQRGTAPQIEGLAQGSRRRLVVVPGNQPACLGEEGFEAGGVEGTVVDLGDVAERLRQHDRVVAPVAQGPAQARDEHPQRPDGSLWRPPGPEVLDQTLGRNHPVGRGEEENEDGSLTASRNRHRPTLVGHFERTEDSKLH